MTSLKLINLHLVFNYNYKNAHLTNDVCVICGKNLMHTFIEQSKNIYTDKVQNMDTEKVYINNNMNNNVVKGKCGHIYHEICIKKNLSENKTLCPIDKTPWNQEYTIGGKKTIKKSEI